jgi:diguanylate cyclase (GGDEF)-like protein
VTIADSDRDADHDRTAISSRAEMAAAANVRRDRAYLIVLAGERLGEMFRVEASGAVIGRAAEASLRLNDDGVSRRHARIVVSGGQVQIEDLGSANGTLVNGERVARAVLRDGDKVQVGETTILKFTYTDELEEKFRKRMYDAALYDSLTKACNKQHFLQRLETEVAYAKRHGAALALLMLDIDHFKKINDTWGHPAGDCVLAALGQVIKATVRTEDIFARYGGEEFAVLCRSTDADTALALGERLRTRVQTASVEYEGQPIPVTASIGVASWFDQPDSLRQLIADADQALYKAKGAGRNRVVVRATLTR